MAFGDFPALTDPSTMGILAAAMQGLQASGPSRMPVSMGQVIGQAGSAGLNAYQSVRQQMMKEKQTEALIQLERMKAQQSQMSAMVQLEDLNRRRAFEGLPPLNIGALQGLGRGGAPGVAPMVGMGGAVGMPNQAPQAAPVMPPQQQGASSPFDAAIAHLPPDQQKAARYAYAFKDDKKVSELIASGNRRSISGIGEFEYNPQTKGWNPLPGQEEALSARTRAAEQAKKDVEEASKPEEFVFGTGMKRQPVQTTAAIANALRTGVAPDEDTATKASLLAHKMGYGVQVAVRPPPGQKPLMAQGLLGKGEQIGGEGSTGEYTPPGARPTPAQAVREKAVGSANEEAARVGVKNLLENHDKLKDAPVQLATIERAKALVGDAKMFMGPFGEVKLNVSKFLRGNVPGFSNFKTDNVSSAEELRTAIFTQIMDNLKKMDAQPSQQQQFIMQQSLGNLGTDASALPKILDVMGSVIAGKVEIHNKTVGEAEQRGTEFPFDPKINLGLPKTPATPKKGDVRGGWEFIGGDPGNKMNWRKK